jgi:hypothetical protein
MTTETAAEHAVAATEAAVETVIHEAEAALEAANDRAAAAAEVAKLVTEAAVQREISDDVEELSGELEECRENLASVRSEMTVLRAEMTTLQQSLTTLVTAEMLTAAISKLSPQPSIPANSSQSAESLEKPSHHPEQSGSTPSEEPAKPKPSRFRLT